MPEQCRIGSHQYGTLVDAHGQRLCELCGEPSDWMPDPCDIDDPEYGQRESCWHCHGAGGWHDCGEDCCPCARPEINETCPECDGTGWI